MSNRSILDHLLQSAQELANQGSQAIQKGLKLPEPGPERDAKVAGLKRGAAMGGLLALLLGTRAGRRVGGSALKIGSLAALGTVAWRAYQNWKGDSPKAVAAGKLKDWSPGEKGGFINELSDDEVDQRSLFLIRAMVGAAKADGHFDDKELSRIESQIDEMELDSAAAMMLRKQLQAPLTPAEVAQGVTGLPAAAEVYLTSVMVIDVDDPAERRYLDELADALGLDREFARKIEAEAS